MAHEIDFTTGRAGMAYVGETPWHGLGEQLEDGATIDQWRVAAGLDWTIQQQAVFHGIIDANGDKKAKVIDGKSALVRSDTQECLSIMGDKYKVVQPGDVLEFYRSLVETSDQFTLETAGSLFGGRKIWALARSNVELRLMGTDVIKPYLLLATSCDGSMATTAQFTSVRVVCNNTLSLSVGSKDKHNAIKVPHSTEFKPETVKDQLGLVNDEFAIFADNADQLAQAAISDVNAMDYFVSLYAPKVADNTAEISTRNKNQLNEIMALYKNGPGSQLRSASGTAWGLVNAVTRYEDHHSNSRSNNNRFNSGQFGAGATRKAEAFDAALVLAA